MNSLEATLSNAYYHPPTYVPSGIYKKQSIHTFQSSKEHDKFVHRGVVQFELPFDGYCEYCDVHVGKGTTCNATKRQAGNYLNTNIWEFRMRCRHCTISEFVIRTNPQSRTFDYVTRIKLKLEEWDMKEVDIGNGILLLDDNDSTTTNNMHKNVSKPDRNILQKGEMTEHDHIQALMKLQASTQADNATSNSNLRATFRIQRNIRKRNRSETILKEQGIVLQDATREDEVASKFVFRTDSRLERKVREREKNRFRTIRSSIFDTGKKCRRSLRYSKHSRSLKHCLENGGKGMIKPVNPIRIELKENPRAVKSIHQGDINSDGDDGTDQLNPLSLVAMYTSDSDSLSLYKCVFPFCIRYII